MVSWGLDTMKMTKLTQVSRAMVAGGQITETVPSRRERSGWTFQPHYLSVNRKHSCRQGQVNIHKYEAFSYSEAFLLVCGDCFVLSVL